VPIRVFADILGGVGALLIVMAGISGGSVFAGYYYYGDCVSGNGGATDCASNACVEDGSSCAPSCREAECDTNDSNCTCQLVNYGGCGCSIP
jgi:hypothetical protein